MHGTAPKHYLMLNFCPDDFTVGPCMDTDTYEYTNLPAVPDTQGCRGITCQECWETEIEEGVE